MLSSDEKKWFVALTAKRKNAVTVLEEEGLISVFVSHIVDTYRDSAHFIFELLQNADDVKATHVRFVLRKDGIFFAHNGSIRFTISDPSLERREGIIPGHINSITTFSLSTKKEDIENKIGKFGIGFKSVFQYTNSPHIYNPPFSFVIRNYMIPEEVEFQNDFLINGETTAFWLPFDKDESSYSEVKKKLEEINNPLLFLRNVKNIEINSSNQSRYFSKQEEKKAVELIGDSQVSEVRLNQDLIIKFEKKATITDKEGVTHSLPISIAFIIEINGKVSADQKYRHYYENAWCYFPTKQETKLNYIINAPFILTPNREALKEGRTENKQIIRALAELGEDAIQGLKNLGYLTEEFYTTIPIPKNLPLDFSIIGEKMINKLKSGEFIPTKDGDHISVADSFVCTESLLSDLLTLNSYQSLRLLTGRPKARIVFTERKLFTDQNLFVFFYQTLSGGQQELQSAWLGSKFKKEILESSDKDYHVAFFRYLEARSNVILNKNQPLWSKQFIPVLSDNCSIDIVTPNNKKGDPHVYLGGARILGRHTIADYLVNDPTIKTLLTNVLGFRYPDEFDDFYISLGKYEGSELKISFEENELDVISIKRFVRELPTIKKDQLLERLKNLKFLLIENSDKQMSQVNPFKEVVYYPDKDLLHYFSKGAESKQQIKIDADSEENRSFYKELSVEFSPYYFAETHQLDGLSNFIENISLTESVYLANLLRLWELSINFSSQLSILKEVEWLFDRDGKRKRPNEIHVGFLHPKYLYFDSIHLRLGAIVETIEPDKYAGLNVNEKLILETIGSASEDLSAEEIKKALDNLIFQKKAKKIKDIVPESSIDQTTPEGLLESWTRAPLASAKQKMNDRNNSRTTIPSLPNSIDFWSDGEEDREMDNPGGYLSAPIIGQQYKNERGKTKQIQLEKELELDAKRNQLIEMASQFETYSFGWFKTLLELEDNFVVEDRVKRNPVRVVFRKVEIDKDKLLILSDAPFIPPTIEDIGEVSIILYVGDEKHTIKGEVVSPKKQTLNVKLSNPNQIIGLDLTTVTYCVVEASSPDFILERLKVAFANLDFQDSDNLKSGSLMPKNLKFVFGPPGTGKTTYLSWMIGGKNPHPLSFCDETISPLMDQDKRVLVLTPTNKAADVISERILRNYRENDEYPSWLIRFGQSASLARESIFVGDRLLKPWIYDRCTLVTTIARFPYDFFKVEKEGKEPDDWKLRDYVWDVIIFDEASMINQAAILYVIYYSRQVNPQVQFFIGGDPFQIPPIIQFEYPYWSYLPDPAFDENGTPIFDESGSQIAWRQDGGNIYSFVGLTKDDSFSNPSTSPHQFFIHNLNKQFRSIVPLGALFSAYRYNGLLSHDRTEESIENGRSQPVTEFEIPNFPLKAITVIRFPVKKFGGVYRVRSVKGSPYQLYSAIFSVELIRYVQQHAKTKIGQVYKIGIISPYALQSTIVTKLIEKVGSGPIEVVTGTVHGFQGDECNLILVILNPPKKITRSPRTFLNKKNILNVAISRARDKLMLMIPFDPDKELNIQDLHQINYIEKLASKLHECRSVLIGYESTQIEKVLWGSETFIEDNSLSTTHQNVNIYTEAVRRYEIRQDENAIDMLVTPEILNDSK
jgi:hypothetical protein